MTKILLFLLTFFSPLVTVITLLCPDEGPITVFCIIIIIIISSSSSSSSSSILIIILIS